MRLFYCPPSIVQGINLRSLGGHGYSDTQGRRVEPHIETDPVVLEVQF